MSKTTAPPRRNLMLQSFSSNNTQSIPIDETLEDAIIDLYLSVKIRSNDEVNFSVLIKIQIDIYDETTLAAERQKLKDVDPFTVVEYIKASVEILMNMKNDDKKTTPPAEDDFQSAEESARGDLQTQYEQQLQKYEAEVRNHIKVEQQLKLHIECVQDKLDDTEKVLRRYA